MWSITDCIERIRTYNAALKPELLKPARGILRYPYLSAGSGDSYPDLTDWDSIWSGIGYMYEGDADPLRFTLLNMLEHVQPDGKGQRRIGYQKYSAAPFQIRPFLASGCYAFSAKNGSEWLSDFLYERLHQNLMYWHTQRMGREGLVKWLDGDEGFADNGLCNYAWEKNAVQGVDVNSQMVREHLAMSRLANLRGDGSRAAEHQLYADCLQQRINAVLWHEEQQCYYSLYNPPARHDPSQAIPVQGYNNLWPLWVGIADQQQADQLITGSLLQTDKYRSPYGIRSMAKDERFYNNMVYGLNTPMPGAPHNGPLINNWCSNWQGPIWTVPTWIGIMSLKRYGYASEAESLTSNYLNLICRHLENHGAYFENYHAETGEPLKAPGIGSWYILLPQITAESDDHIFPGMSL